MTVSGAEASSSANLTNIGSPAGGGHSALRHSGYSVADMMSRLNCGFGSPLF
jgi:hypothetical protein